jgi:hypothetical protein
MGEKIRVTYLAADEGKPATAPVRDPVGRHPSRFANRFANAANELRRQIPVVRREDPRAFTRYHLISSGL